MSISSAARAFRPALACLALAFALAPSGCGKSTATVSGTVKFLSDPLPSGTVVFYGPNNDIVTGSIENGKYTIVNAPLGEVRVAVQVQDPSLGTKGAGGPPGAGDGAPNLPPGAEEQKHMTKTRPGERKVVPIPPQYMNPDTSGLSLHVKKGKQPFDIDLQ